MKRLVTAAVTALVAAVIATGVVWVVTLFSGTSFADAVAQPSFWVVQGATIIFTAAAILSQPSTDDGSPARHQSGAVKMLSQAAWTGAGAVVIGALLAIATDVPILDLLTSTKFLIAAGIAVTVAGLEAWPDDEEAADEA